MSSNHTHLRPPFVKSLHEYHRKWRTWWDWITKPREIEEQIEEHMIHDRKAESLREGDKRRREDMD